MEAKKLGADGELQRFHVSEEDYSSYPPAGLGVRLLSGLLDGIFVGILNQITNIITVFIAYGSEASLADFSKLPPLWQASAFVVYVVISFTLIIRPLKISGQTPGKKILKIKVVREDFNEGLSWGQCILREWFGKVISSFLFIISLPMIIFREDKRVIHDFICSTRVIRVKEN